MYKKRLISITILLTVLIFACGKDNEPELGQESSEQLIRRYYQAVSSRRLRGDQRTDSAGFVNFGRLGQPELG